MDNARANMETNSGSPSLPASIRALGDAAWRGVRPRYDTVGEFDEARAGERRGGGGCAPRPNRGRRRPMSLHPHAIGPVPDETARIARAVFPRGNPYLELRDVLGSLYTDEDFADLFPR